MSRESDSHTRKIPKGLLCLLYLKGNIESKVEARSVRRILQNSGCSRRDQPGAGSVRPDGSSDGDVEHVSEAPASRI